MSEAQDPRAEVPSEDVPRPADGSPADRSPGGKDDPAVKLALIVGVGGVLAFMGFGLAMRLGPGGDAEPPFDPMEGTIHEATLPPGYVASEAEGEALRYERVIEGAPPRSIEVVPIEPQPVRQLVVSSFECDGLGTGVRLSLRDTLGQVVDTDSRFIQLPVGRSCRVDVTIEDAADGRRFIQRNVALQSTHGDRMVVCTMGAEDPEGEAECDAYLRSWRWKLDD